MEELVPVPRSAMWPIELRPPPGFRPDVPATWPDIPGRLEFVGGRLLYMPPCGDVQQEVCGSATKVLMIWVDGHTDFVVGVNEAGMILGGDTRGADGAVWRRSDVRPLTGGYRRVPPLLAVEVAGRDENEAMLRDKARWYLANGVGTIWIVLPEARDVIVIAAQLDLRFAAGSRLPAPDGVPDLTPTVDDFFFQLR